jgi:hypothetical protein
VRPEFGWRAFVRSDHSRARPPAPRPIGGRHAFVALIHRRGRTKLTHGIALPAPGTTLYVALPFASAAVATKSVGRLRVGVHGMQSFGMHHWQYAPRAPLRARPCECHAGCTREILTAVFGASAANIAMALQSPQSPRTAAKQARMRPSRTKKVRDDLCIRNAALPYPPATAPDDTTRECESCSAVAAT